MVPVTVKDVDDIKTEGTADSVHVVRQIVGYYRNGDTKMQNSKHYVIMVRNNTGSVIRHSMNADEVGLLYGQKELLRKMMEHFYGGFEVEFFEQVGVKKNESDS